MKYDRTTDHTGYWRNVGACRERFYRVQDPGILDLIPSGSCSVCSGVRQAVIAYAVADDL